MLKEWDELEAVRKIKAMPDFYDVLKENKDYWSNRKKEVYLDIAKLIQADTYNTARSRFEALIVECNKKIEEVEDAITLLNNQKWAMIDKLMAFDKSIDHDKKYKVKVETYLGVDEFAKY